MYELDGIKKMANAGISDKIEKNNGILRDIDIDEVVDRLVMVFASDAPAEEIEKVKKELKAMHNVTLGLGCAVINYDKHKPWFKDRKAQLENKYWERYKEYLINDKKFSSHVIRNMNEVLDRITDYLGDPDRQDSFQRRGLVVGDVQSGKTANYIGLMNKAADAHYQVIFLLTGTIEKLRQQTQTRVDEGFIGNTSTGSPIGVSVYDGTLKPVAHTNFEQDFRKGNAVIRIGIDSKEYVNVFVLKKNKTILENLNTWLKENNMSNGNNVINASCLVIDDESDNASVNTKKEDENPTAINEQIRLLLSKFTRASYVGFTATPYANIFIDPETEDEMLGLDLFPRDYIYSLDSPSNYIGARDIFGENAKYANMIKKLENSEIEEYFGYVRKHTIIDSIPPSLKDAICHFMIGNAIKDLREGTPHSHRSMMINVIRYTNIHIQLEEIVSNYVDSVINSLKIYSMLDDKDALKDNNMKMLHDIYENINYFPNRENLYSWEEVKSQLYKSVKEISVVTVNSLNKNRLDYDMGYIRPIVIGGFSLSRGLTLEGLMTSYLCGNCKLYDALMQRGRWFGYRSGYEDLCSIWLTPETIEAYQSINDATDELRKRLKYMDNHGQLPKDFGLMVRCDKNTLEITSRNKMRLAKDRVFNVTMAEDVFEIARIENNVEANNTNKKALMKFISECGKELQKDPSTAYTSNKQGFLDVPKKYIVDLLRSISVHPSNFTFDPDAISAFIEKNNELENFDVVFITGNGEPLGDEFGILKDLKASKRSFSVNNNVLSMTKRNRLGAQEDGKFNMTKEQLDNVDSIVKGNEDETKNKETASEKDYFRVERKPLLMVYTVNLIVNDKDETETEKSVEEMKKIVDTYSNTPIVSFALGIPHLKDTQTIYAKYKINAVAQKNGVMTDFDDDMEEEEYEY